MKIKLDENLPERLVSKLEALGHDVDTVRGEHMAGRDDSEVWLAAQSSGRFLITQDLDFSDMRRYAPGDPRRFAARAPVPPWPGGSGGSSRHVVRDGACRPVARLPGGRNRHEGASQAPRLNAALARDPRRTVSRR